LNYNGVESVELIWDPALRWGKGAGSSNATTEKQRDGGHRFALLLIKRKAFLTLLSALECSTCDIPSTTPFSPLTQFLLVLYEAFLELQGASHVCSWLHSGVRTDSEITLVPQISS
jgi:hypothetical protein